MGRPLVSGEMGETGELISMCVIQCLGLSQHSEEEIVSFLGLCGC